MKTLQALQAAGWTVAEQRQDRWRIERGDWVLEVNGRQFSVTLTLYADWMPHGMEVARIESYDGPWPDDALVALMALPFGSRTVGDFCGVPAVVAVNPSDALKAAGWDVLPNQGSALYANRPLTPAEPWDEQNQVDVWLEDGCYHAMLGEGREGDPCAEGETAEAAFWALMALPFGAVTVGAFCGMA
jgi:hypothetical protein